MKSKFTFFKKFLTILFPMFLAFGASAQCNYEIVMQDSWGDGWNGASLNVTINGGTATTYQLTTGGDITYELTGVNPGDAIVVTYIIGSNVYPTENYYALLDASGAVVGSQGSVPCTACSQDNDANDPTSTSISGTVACPSCVIPAATFTPTTCSGENFGVTVDVTTLGDGNPYTISDDQGTATQSITAAGSFVYGSYAGGTVVSFTISSDANPTGCSITGSATEYCPPCTNGGVYQGGAANNVNSNSVQFSTCNYAGEYSNATGLLAANTYEVSSSAASDYITVTSSDGTVIESHGTAPHTFTVSADGDYRVYYHLTSPSCGTESVCRITSMVCTSCPIEPTNNDCGQAININGAGGQGTPTGSAMSFTTAGATATTGEIAVLCAGDPDDDVWFEFTSDADGGTVDVEVIGGAGVTAQWEMYSGACGGLTSEGCNTPVTLAATTQYWIRVWDIGTGFTGGGAEERAAGSFTIQVSGAALPAEVVSFTGKAMDKTNMLIWETATEENVEEFVIERSTDGISDWTNVNSMPARGNSQELLKYELEDFAPLASAYYRLRSVDFDGYTQLSKLIQITRKSTRFDIVNIAPNPTNDITVVTFEALSNVQITGKVMDVTGKVISTISQDAVEGSNILELDLSTAPSGIYFLTLNNGVANVTQRIVKN